jgi:hypothetical protein
MPTLTFSVQPDGLVVDVMIGLHAAACHTLQQAGQQIPRPILVRGVMDTATDATAVAPGVLQALGLPQYGKAQTHTAAGPVQVNVYEISLSILSPTGATPMFTAPRLLATELISAAPGIDVLVGLDVILQGILHIDGPGGVFGFTF